MKKRNTGRNSPCPCGSGKKYKYCCLNKEQQYSTTSDDNNEIPGLRDALGNQQFSSLEQANEFVQRHTQKRNQAPRSEFHGLSSEQMHRILHFPFESPDVVIFSDKISDEIIAPILTLFSLLADGIGKNGIKPTAKGNLPRNLSRNIALNYWGEKKFQQKMDFFKVNKEEDFFDLHVTRLVSQLAGLIRKYKGKFVLTKKCQSLLTRKQHGQLFILLFEAYVKKFNWGYWDGYEEFPLIQHSFAFTLYLIDIYGQKEQSNYFYSDHFINAFPMLIDETPHEDYIQPADYLQRCYTWRALLHFVEFFGLAKVEALEKDKLLNDEYRIQKLPLLDEFLYFQNGTMH